MQNYKSKLKIFAFLFVILMFNFSFLISNLGTVSAINMESSRYKIQFGNLNIGADNISSEGANLSLTMGQLAAEEFSRNGYIIKAGFQYVHSIVPFSFSVSNSNINLGSLLPNVGVGSTASSDLKVSFGGAGNYQVTAVEKGPMTTFSGAAAINDTSCDDGCTESLPRPWTSASAYGFGYKMSGEDIPDSFTTCGNTCYRRFADDTAEPADSPEVVMSSNNVTVDLTSKPKDIIHQSTITFKANISSIQPAGTYQTIIHFVATPSY